MLSAFTVLATAWVEKVPGNGPCMSLIVLQRFVKAGPVDDMAELMHENALQLHPSRVLHHVLLCKNHRGTRADVGQETALTPVVKIQLLPGFAGGELRQLRGQLVMADQQAEHFLFANPLGDLRLESAHEHVELIRRDVNTYICIRGGVLASVLLKLWFSFQIIVFAAFFFIIVIIEAFVKARKAEKNPWGKGATTFEWKLSSPPPFHSYDDIPKVK